MTSLNRIHLPGPQHHLLNIIISMLWSQKSNNIAPNTQVRRSSDSSYYFQKKVEPWKLYTMVTGLLTIDLIILLCWQFYDPLQRITENFPLETPPKSSADDIKISPELEHCESRNNNIWYGKWDDDKP